MVNEGGIGILPSDLLFQVLSRLPPKTLLKFKCVSKHWSDFISDPFFVNLHANLSKNKPLKLGVDHILGSGTFNITIIDALNSSSAERFSLTFATDDYTIFYCSGILLFHGENDNLHVCNPSTWEFFTIPPFTLIDKIKSRLPDSCTLVAYQGLDTGFGFCPSTSVHKIVSLFVLKHTNECENNLAPIIEPKALVMTLANGSKEGSWKHISVVNSFEFWNCSLFHPICVSGIMYWLKKSVCNHMDGMEKRPILTFDLEAEEFQVINCPRYLDSLYIFFLLELKGVACLVDLLLFEPVINIWLLKDCKGEIWVKEYAINYSSITRSPNHSSQFFIPLHGIVDEDGKKEILFESDDCSLYSYNLNDKTFARSGRYKRYFTHEFVHCENLLPASSSGLV